MPAFGRLMIVILCLLFNMNSYAAESEEEKDSPWLLTPTISSDPKLGTTLGFLWAYLKKFDEESPASMFGIMGSYSDTDSFFYGGEEENTEGSDLFPSAGVGVTFTIKPEEKMLVRAEYAVGKSDNSAFYLRFGQPF